ncbi:MAG: FecR domain-containing protein [Archangium sp.]|nr:FecR domain-containing protein [Archangium sp.]
MSRRPLSDFVTPPQPDPTSLHVEWHEVRRRVRRHRQVRVAGVVAASLVVVLGVVAAVVRTPEPSLLPGQQALAVEAPRRLTLTDGSVVELAMGGQLALALADEHDVVVVLERGRASFDVSKKPTRQFVVKADSIEVRVIGTKFRVRREGPAVEVEVERGIVEVRDGAVVRRLVKGERWARVVQAVAAEPGQEPAQDDEAPAEATTPAKRKVNVRRPARAPEPVAEQPLTAPVAQSPPVEPPTETEAQTAPTPADTFAAAMRARGAGRPKEAIVGFQQVCERWPSSAFAPMSAFEWGRLALDTQDDPRQAARAFERTLELATSDSLIEDALARLTEAYARYDAGSCRRAQSDYLRRFPGGPHVRGVTKACPP